MGINPKLTFQSVEMIFVEGSVSDDDLSAQKQNEVNSSIRILTSNYSL